MTNESVRTPFVSWSDRQNLAPSQLLRPEFRVVPLIGFEDDVNSLLDWAETSDATIKFLIGDAGIGKTRLGLEVVSRLLDEGWSGGVVADFESVSLDEYEDSDVVLLVDQSDSQQNAVLEFIKENESFANRLKLICIRRVESNTGLVRWSPYLDEAGIKFDSYHLVLDDAYPWNLFASTAKSVFAEVLKTGFVAEESSTGTVNLFVESIRMLAAALGSSYMSKSEAVESVLRADLECVAITISSQHHHLLPRALVFLHVCKTVIAEAIKPVFGLSSDDAQSVEVLDKALRGAYDSADRTGFEVQPTSLADAYLESLLPADKQMLEYTYEIARGEMSAWMFTEIARASRGREGLTSLLIRNVRRDMEELAELLEVSLCLIGDPVGEIWAQAILTPPKPREALLLEILNLIIHDEGHEARRVQVAVHRALIEIYQAKGDEEKTRYHRSFLATNLRQIGLGEEALVQSKGALTLARKLAKRGVPGSRLTLAKELMHCALEMKLHGSRVEEAELCEEAETILRIEVLTDQAAVALLTEVIGRKINRSTEVGGDPVINLSAAHEMLVLARSCVSNHDPAGEGLLLDALGRMSRTLMNQSAFSDALPFAKERLEVCQRRSAAVNRGDLSAALAQYAEVLDGLGDHDGSIQAYSEALQDALLEVDVTELSSVSAIGICLSMMAVTYRSQKPDMTVGILETAHTLVEIHENEFGKDSGALHTLGIRDGMPIRIQVLRGLVAVHEELGNVGEAQLWQGRLDEQLVV